MLQAVAKHQQGKAGEEHATESSAGMSVGHWRTNKRDIEQSLLRLGIVSLSSCIALH
jgi:hypothetical protein